MEKNLTSGSVFRNIMYFSLPYLLSYFLQTLYGMADLFIIGQFHGVEHITAVSIGSQVMHMLTVMIVGLAMGSTVTIGKAIGAKRSEHASLAIGNTITLFMGVSAAFTALLLVLVKPIVSVMSTPKEAAAATAAYLTICFIGIPFITAYNIISSIFRGLGDSKSPMYFIAAACAANIVLDYLFIGVFQLGALGAALGTTLSQTISVIFSIIVILRQKNGVRLKRQHFRPQAESMGQILKIGIPVALQDGFIQISFIVITVIANRSSWHCRKNNWCGVFGAFYNAFHRFCSLCAKYWCRKTRSRIKNFVVCNSTYGGIWPYRVGWSAMGSHADCGNIYGGCSRYFVGDTVSERIYLGLHFCRNTFFVQWIFLCLRKIRNFLSPQCALYCLCAHSRRVPGLEIFCRHFVSYGTCCTRRIFVVSFDLCCGFFMDEKAGNGILCHRVLTE